MTAFAASAIRHPIARGVLIAAGLSPFFVALARAALPLGAVGEAADHLFLIVCHQRADRTLALAGVPMPVCSRCAGIYAGTALAALLARPRLAVRGGRLAFAFAGALMLIDVVLQELDVHAVWHVARLATGGLFGYAAVLLVLAYLAPSSDRAPLEVFLPARDAIPTSAPTCVPPPRGTR